MLRLIAFIVVSLFLVGCANKEVTTSDEGIHIYQTKVDTVFFKEKKSREVLQRFPFISVQKKEPKGKFSDEFYANIDYVYTAKKIDEVNYWELEKEPKSVDFIYVFPIWIKDYKNVSDDLFTNIAYSYNISNEEQEILKEWIRGGGVLWVESGVYSTKYDLFTRGGEIATGKIRSIVLSDLEGKRFLGKAIKSYLFKSKNLDMVNYVPSSKTFNVVAKDDFFKDVRRLKLVVDNYLQNDFVILDKTLLATRNGDPVVTISSYGKGYIVSLLPFEYEDVYYDGELLRWKLFYYLLKKRRE